MAKNSKNANNNKGGNHDNRANNYRGKDRRSNGRGKTTGNLRGQQDSVNSAPFSDDSRGGKNQRRAEEAVDTFAAMSKSNPLEYYTKFSRFAEDAARLPFAFPLGTPFDTVQNGVDQQTRYAVPGIMRIEFSPAIGISRDFTSAINRSSTRFYTYLRSNQKASANYDHQDITMMELALDSAYMFHAMCRRLYGVMQNVTPMNEYYARSLVAAMGGVYSDLRANLADFRAWINTFAYNLGQYALPAGITLFDRHRWMCDGYYVDSETTRAQTYVFVPLGFWMYDNTVETGSQLTFTYYLDKDSVLTAKQYTTAQLMALGDSLLNAIGGEEDFQYISGDIYNFYGGQTYSLPYVEENYKVVPAFEKTVLSQIENMRVMGRFAADPIVSQKPDVNDGAIIYNPTFKRTMLDQAGVRVKTFMNFHWDSPSSGDVIEASRLLPTIAVPQTGATTVLLEQCGTEIVHGLAIFATNPASGATRFNGVDNTIVVLGSTVATLKNNIFDALHLAQFDWAPGLQFFAQSAGSSGITTSFIGFSWDIDNFSEIFDNYLNTIHDACLYSLFEVGSNRVDLT